LGYAVVLVSLVVGAVAGWGVYALAIRMGWRWRSAARWERGGVIDVRAVFDEMSDGAAIFDFEGNVLVSNKALNDALGMEQGMFSRSALVNDFQHFSGDGELLSMEHWPITRALRGDFVQGFEVQSRRRDTGVTKTALLTTSPVKDTSGNTVQILLLRRDITEHKQFNAMALRLAAIVDSSEDAIVGKDDHGIVTSWNRGAEKIFGYTAEEMIGRSLRRLLPLDRQTEEDEIMARIRAGETVDHLETTRLRKDGTVILMSVTISPIHDGRGRIVGASKVGRDITAQRKLERQLHQSQKMEAIGQLTGGIAHDFNNLLGIVIGNLDLLEPLIEDNEAATKRLSTAQRASLRGADLTRRLLAFSCNEDLNPTLTSLGESIHSTLELAGRGLGPEVRIVTHLDVTVPDVMVDRPGLESLLLNLAVNSRDAMPEGGTLTVSTHVTYVEESGVPKQMGELRPGSYACVSVTDTGTGMSRETLERVFEPFFTTKARGRGTGLGLAMAYGFMKQSGGTVKIYSELGYGTTVSFYLPIRKQERVADAIPQAEMDLHNLQGCTVLLVDDEEDLLEIAETYVAEMGCAVVSAIDGHSALAILASPIVVDLMITDIIMPGGMSGTALAERARVLRPAMQIVYCSGFPADALAERASLALDAPLLRKPYQRADVHAFVRRAMSQDERYRTSAAG